MREEKFSYFTASGDEITFRTLDEDAPDPYEVACWRNPGTDDEECMWLLLFKDRLPAIREYERWK